MGSFQAFWDPPTCDETSVAWCANLKCIPLAPPPQGPTDFLFEQNQRYIPNDSVQLHLSLFVSCFLDHRSSSPRQPYLPKLLLLRHHLDHLAGKAYLLGNLSYLVPVKERVQCLRLIQLLNCTWWECLVWRKVFSVQSLGDHNSAVGLATGCWWYME